MKVNIGYNPQTRGIEIEHGQQLDDVITTMISRDFYESVMDSDPDALECLQLRYDAIVKNDFYFTLVKAFLQYLKDKRDCTNTVIREVI